MNYAQAFKEIEIALTQVGEDKENLTYVFKELKSWTSLNLLMHLREEITTEDQLLLQEIKQKLLDHQPPQYITGKAYFRDLLLSVDARVLIPRPETEELVDLILKENPENRCSVLDIGTGSGAIALSLKKERPSWCVQSSDISLEALQLAKQNAKQNNLNISFIHSDIFSSISEKYDIIVSNPPYISYDDKAEVAKNVINHEPHLALFASNNGYSIYESIAKEASYYLNESGKLYFEIGYKQGETIKLLFEKYFPEKRVRILRDQFGKDRMVIVNNG
ncbi:protein-(glutamine-N5) methyltransferase, release factor-specific [Streptococcus urinalis FB127-CNA-2]|uniref:Release factor glutamine methyltransferase n=1 Tax=Streptococcus urinalis 2285-97 TaxID=764291 RepID=G5KFU0_9STRE|nr:peptide chain release factor N(5)-glutamine methyltransferase [Streptococcus urinalis]EHJ56885.1 protein-(glutamine-N5) methyltransferase, release factor-specific [Streptococcus urinalis 2285-97]EKS22151.1 protein-(glutamine-N5) methyltransferase, release factor-specific [Streptococcus urinalis FB127-CNA-2]VEF31963.1 methyltransferase [Streptococcus urinalis]